MHIRVAKNMIRTSHRGRVLAFFSGVFSALFVVPVFAAQSVPAAEPAIVRIAGAPVRAPHATPAIFTVNLATRQIHSGDTVHAVVLTSSNVASVEARIRGFGMNLDHVGVGRFATTYHVPWLPFFLHGHWPVRVIARNVDGVSTQKTVYITYN